MVELNFAVESAEPLDGGAVLLGLEGGGQGEQVRVAVRVEVTADGLRQLLLEIGDLTINDCGWVAHSASCP